MRKITQEELNEIIRKHKLWLTGNSEGERANLRDADMSDKTLSYANLRGADLLGADLTGADLRGADLENADLTGANLTDADLRDANLRDANLRGADLENADLTGANLTDADLRYADLLGANLTDADLRDANLTDADLLGANLENAINLSMPMVCPTHGSFIAWKKCYRESEAYMVKLQIPASAKRLSGTGRKCRTDKAEVLEIQTLDGEKIDLEYVCSRYCPDFQYKVGETARPTEPFCEDRWQECSSGIHFFIDREEAVNY